MSENNKPEEVVAINQPNKPDAVATEEVKDDKPVTPTEEVTTPTDEEIEAQLRDNVQPEQKPSRKTRAIERSVNSYNKVLDENDHVDFDKLLVEYEKNPKGLASFAEANNFDINELQNEIDNELGKKESEIYQRLSAIEDTLWQKQAQKSANAYVDKVKDLVASVPGLTLSDFYTSSGENFNLIVDGLRARGKTAAEAAEIAFEKIKPSLNVTAEKDALLNNSKTMPLGNEQIIETELKVAPRAEVNSWPDAKRIAYKRKFKQADGSIKYE